MEIKSSHRSPLNRQITEAVRIAREPNTNILNSKNEYGANNLAEICLKYGTKVALKPQIRTAGVTDFKRKRDRDGDDDDEDSTTKDEPNEEATLETDQNPRPTTQTLVSEPSPGGGDRREGHRDPCEDTGGGYQ